MEKQQVKKSKMKWKLKLSESTCFMLHYKLYIRTYAVPVENVQLCCNYSNSCDICYTTTYVTYGLFYIYPVWNTKDSTNFPLTFLIFLKKNPTTFIMSLNTYLHTESCICFSFNLTE